MQNNDSKYKQKYVVVENDKLLFLLKKLEGNRFNAVEDYIKTICNDIENNKVSRKEVIDTLRDTFIRDAEYNFAWRSMRWEDARQYIRTDEFREKVNKYVEDMLSRYKDKLPDRGYYYAIIEYGDDDGDYFSELEHHIMPRLPFVLKRISHH